MNSQTMNCVMIAPEGTNVKLLREAISSSFLFEMTSWLKDYPDESALLRMLRLNAPDLVVIDFTDMPKALRTVTVIQHNAPNTQIMALCEEHINVLSTLLRAGVRDYVTEGSTFEDITDTLKAQYENLSRRPETIRNGGDLISFLPAKPGSGAFAASKSPDKRILLADFDRNSGVLSFLFKLRAELTLRDALTSVNDMDVDVWTRIRSQVGDLDILPADLDCSALLDGGRASRLLQFFRRAYDLTCVDLSGQLDSFAIETLLESKRVYLVCTQELACQHLLLRKVERLRRSGIDKQMRLIVNRFMPRHVMTADRISDLVGVPVELTIANDYEAANCSMENGALVKLDSNLGRSYKRLAELMVDNRIVVPKSKPSFLEFFSQPFMKSSAESAR
jgi:Flp pilus assembly CpaE family ATPase